MCTIFYRCFCLRFSPPLMQSDAASELFPDFLVPAVLRRFFSVNARDSHRLFSCIYNKRKVKD